MLIIIGKKKKDKEDQERIEEENMRKKKEAEEKKRIEEEYRERERLRLMEEKKLLLIEKCAIANPPEIELLHFNVSGKLFYISERTLLKDNSLFSFLVKQSKINYDGNGVIRIARNPILFEFIIDWLRKYDLISHFIKSSDN